MKLNIVNNDPSDNAILESALVAEVEFIVTGDEDLLTIREYKGIRIVSPTDFVGKHR